MDGGLRELYLQHEGDGNLIKHQWILPNSLKGKCNIYSFLQCAINVGDITQVMHLNKQESIMTTYLVTLMD
jgi:hypothetical protein